MTFISQFKFSRIGLSPLTALAMTALAMTGHVVAQDQNASAPNQLTPLLQKYCYQCHSGDESSGDITLDTLATSGPELSGESWSAVLDVINSGDMPPEDELQPTAEDREQLVAELTRLLSAAAQTTVTQEPVLRRLTRAQYTNSLQTLLGLDVDFGNVMPEDGKSKMGFSNNADVLQTTSLHFEYYEKIARSAIEKAIVTGPRPESIHFRVTFGKDIESKAGKMTGTEIGGFQSVTIKNTDFRVELLDEEGEVRQPTDDAEAEKLKKMYGSIAIGLRGSARDRFQVLGDGVQLFSALPHKEAAPKSWQGPSPNLKILFQHDFSRQGDFRMKVVAGRTGLTGKMAKTSQGLITLRNPNPAVPSDGMLTLNASECKSHRKMDLTDNQWLVPQDVTNKAFAKFNFDLPADGIYQVDFVHPHVSADMMPSVEIRIDKSLTLQERLNLDETTESDEVTTALTLARMTAGKHQLMIGGKFFTGFKEVRISRLNEDDPATQKLRAEESTNREKFSSKLPGITAYAGTRTDDGMDYSAFGKPQNVTGEAGEFESFEFRGRLENMPLPVFEVETRDKLSNISLFGIWNNHLVKNSEDSGPPLLVKSIELELPWTPVWPPPSHTKIFQGKVPDQPKNRARYTRKLLSNFMSRTFRRPVAKRELDRYMDFWNTTQGDFDSYEESVTEVLVAVLCSPNFLYMVQPSASGELLKDNNDPAATPTDQFLLASRLSYFLWNSPPDQTLLKLARQGKLHEELAAQTDRMIEDPKIMRMIRPFAWEWLRIDRLESMKIDTSKYADFTRFVKSDMKQETSQFLLHVLTKDLPLTNLIDSDFAVINQNLAEFYGIRGVEGTHFRPVALPAGAQRGGLLSQGAFLSGHSDGQQAHPIKRAVWLKEKILGDPPPPAPPNVPDLDPETPGFEKLTLKEQLELHRNKPSCVSCHKKIDPYGIVFQNYDAVGRFQKKNKRKPIDATVVLPDGTEVTGVEGMKRYILDQKQEDFCRSITEHLMAYAIGRDVGYSDREELDAIVDRIQKGQGGFRSVFREIVLSPSFSGQTDTKQNPRESNE